MGAEESVLATMGRAGSQEREREGEGERGEREEREKGEEVGKHPMDDCISLRGEKKRNNSSHSACVHMSHRVHLRWKESREGVGGRGGEKERGKEKICQVALVKREESYCSRR